MITWGLLVLLVLAVVGVIALSLTPGPSGRTYTEFYLLGPEGNASGYPTELNVSEEASLIVGVTNYEGETISYRVEVAWNETTVETFELELAEGENGEHRVTVVAPDDPGVYELRFRVFRAGSETELSDPLFLRVTVI